MIYKLSPSSLSLMKSCKRCFWLDKHGVWKRPNGIFPTLPSGMDRILKIHFDKFRDKGKLPPELCDHKHCEDMKLFDDIALLEAWRNNFKGIRYTDEEGNVLFGAVDNVLVKGNKLIILDYKTKGFPIKNENESAEYYQNQLDIYNFLLQKKGYETETYAFLLFYVPEGVLETGEVLFSTSLVKRDVDVQNAERIFKGAISLLNGECPTDSCEWCEGKN